MAIKGSSAGAKPIKEAICLLCEYAPFGSTFWSGPGFPGNLKIRNLGHLSCPFLGNHNQDILHPLSGAGRNYPSYFLEGNSLTVWPSLFLISLTMKGFINTPPLAIAEVAETSCKAVTPTSCPIGTAPIEVLDQFLVSFNIPDISPGRSTANFFPKPNKSAYL